MAPKRVKIDVTWEDQQHINAFGRLNLRALELEAECRLSKVGIRTNPSEWDGCVVILMDPFDTETTRICSRCIQ